jgi:hypothetical protein
MCIFVFQTRWFHLYLNCNVLCIYVTVLSAVVTRADVAGWVSRVIWFQL